MSREVPGELDYTSFGTWNNSSLAKVRLTCQNPDLSV
jgi:hypothetical protein